MTALLAGLVLFLGVHSVRMLAGPWRDAQRARLGENGWKGLYSVASLAGFALLLWGFGQARYAAPLWVVPTGAAHLAALLMLPSFVLLAAAYVPGTRIKAKVGHPMVAGVKLWALAHLLANARPASVLLFTAFLVWSVALFIASRRRDRLAGTVYPTGPVSRDIVAVVAGTVAWAVFAMWGHKLLIGVAPFGTMPT
jgi:uncharacterized membrane protein